MFKGFEYNKECGNLLDKSKYAEEHKILCDFLNTDHENVCLDYENEKDAIPATQSLRMWIRKGRKPLKLLQRKQYVFAIKASKE